ncbi:MAG: hypothetical protein IJR41_06255 [Atopobiaceae bacterium]|nr:hypothetical protein [Atopobiaceae bacterium]
MTKTQELMLRLLAVAAGAAISSLNLLIGATLKGTRRYEMERYSKQLSDEFEEIAKELQ